MSNKEIRKALNKITEQLAADLSTSQWPVLINWENVMGDHANRTAIYLEPALLPAPTQWAGLQGGAVYTGIYQISLVYPAGVGTTLADGFAEAIVNSPLWRTQQTGGPRIQLVEPPYYGAVLEDPDAARIPITISYMVSA